MAMVGLGQPRKEMALRPLFRSAPWCSGVNYGEAGPVQAMDFGIRATAADASSPKIFSKCPGPTRQQTCAPADARLEQRRHVGAEPRPPRHLFGSRRSWI